MLTLDETITRYKALSTANRSRAESYNRGEDYELMKAKECETCADECEQVASWLEELLERRETEPIVYEVTEDSHGFIVETNDDRNIGLRKVSTRNISSAMWEITEKYWDEGLKVVFKFYCGNGDEWQKIYESEVKT